MVREREPMPPGRGTGRRRPVEINDRQSFIDILGTVLKYVLIVVLIMVMVSLAREAYAIGYDAFSEEAMAPSGQGREVTVEITSSMSVKEIGTLLADNGLIRDARAFPLQERFSSYHGEIVPGTYTLSTEMTPDQILQTLSQNYEGKDSSGAGESAAADDTVSDGESAVDAVSDSENLDDNG